jgi:hypothetical protein
MEPAHVYNILCKVTTAEPKQATLVSIVRIHVRVMGGDGYGI